MWSAEREDRDRERESVFRIRDRRWLDNALREEITLSRLEKDRTDGLLGAAAADAKRTSLAGGGAAASSNSGNPLSFGEELQFWPEKDGHPARYMYMTRASKCCGVLCMTS